MPPGCFKKECGTTGVEAGGCDGNPRVHRFQQESREAPDQVGEVGTGRGKRRRRVERLAVHPAAPRRRLAHLKVEDVHNNVGSAIQQNNVPANHHMRAVRRWRR